MGKIKVTGCIVTYNNSDIIEKCIASILQWTQEIDFKLIISDNCSTDDTVCIIEEKFPKVTVLKNKENKGFGHGHNAVMPYLDSKYHFVINPDIFMDSEAISKMVYYMENHRDVAMITPRIMNDNGTEQHLPKRNPNIRYLFLSKLKPFKKYRRIYTREDEKLSIPTEIDFCTGCFFGIRTALFKKMGGFDTRYFMYMEDADISRTIRKYYKIIFYPLCHVYHKWHRENIKNLRGIQRWLRSMIKYFNKWGWKY